MIWIIPRWIKHIFALIRSSVCAMAMIVSVIAKSANLMIILYELYICPKVATMHIADYNSDVL